MNPGSPLSSDRAFGFLFAFLLAAGAAYCAWKGMPWGWALGAAALLLAGIAALRPGSLAPANRLWAGLGLLLGRIVNPVVIAIMFFVVITPVGLLMRAFGKRPLGLDFDRRSSTYWIARESGGPAPQSMRDQF